MLLFLHVAGIKCLHRVGLELVVAVERGIKADKLLRICLNNGINQFFGNAVFQADEQRAFGNGKNLLAFCRKDRDLLRGLEPSLEEYFKEKVFL